MRWRRDSVRAPTSTPSGTWSSARLPAGRPPGRSTIFDSSGIVAQDLAVADFALARALHLGLTTDVELFDG